MCSSWYTCFMMLLTFHKTSCQVSFWRRVPWAEMVEKRVWQALFLTADLSSTHRSDRCLGGRGRGRWRRMRTGGREGGEQLPGKHEFIHVHVYTVFPTVYIIHVPETNWATWVKFELINIYSWIKILTNNNIIIKHSVWIFFYGILVQCACMQIKREGEPQVINREKKGKRWSLIETRTGGWLT